MQPDLLKQKKQLDEGRNTVPGRMVLEGNLPQYPLISVVPEAGKSVESGMIVTQDQGESSEDRKYVTAQDLVSSTSARTGKSPQFYLTPENYSRKETSARTHAIPDKDYQETIFVEAQVEGQSVYSICNCVDDVKFIHLYLKL